MPQSFEDSCAAALDTLYSLLPDGTSVFLTHLDRTREVSRIVDSRGPGRLVLVPGHAATYGDCLAARVALEQLPGFGSSDARMLRRAVLYRSYAAVALTLHYGTAIGVMCAVSLTENAFDRSHELLLSVQAKLVTTSAKLEAHGGGLDQLDLVLSGSPAQRRFEPAALKQMKDTFLVRQNGP